MTDLPPDAVAAAEEALGYELDLLPYSQIQAAARVMLEAVMPVLRAQVQDQLDVYIQDNASLEQEWRRSVSLMLSLTGTLKAMALRWATGGDAGQLECARQLADILDEP